VTTSLTTDTLVLRVSFVDLGENGYTLESFTEAIAAFRELVVTMEERLSGRRYAHATSQLQVIEVSYRSPLHIILGVPAGTAFVLATVHRLIRLVERWNEMRVTIAKSKTALQIESLHRQALAVLEDEIGIPHASPNEVRITATDVEQAARGLVAISDVELSQ